MIWEVCTHPSHFLDKKFRLAPLDYNHAPNRRNLGTCLSNIKSNRTKVVTRVSVACMHHERGLFRSLPHFPALPLQTPHSFLLPLLEKTTKGTHAHTHIYMHMLLGHILHVQCLSEQIRKNEKHKVGTIRRLKLSRIRILECIVSVQKHSKPARKIKQKKRRNRRKKQNKTKRQCSKLLSLLNKFCLKLQTPPPRVRN
jgi:hypothetical protein